MSTNIDCHIAFINYFATGEGVTILIAAGGSSEHAKNVFNRHAPEYFRGGVEVARLNDAANDRAKRVAEMIPQRMRDLLQRNPIGTTEYYSELHFNLT
ncbi:hypothetical protein [Dokdonella soli]|uniref:Uncharacterized protein n=1 Tax=Dokdonella soli TaxID=529810 RepID=A0ABP3U9Q8_9GAMM